MTDREKAIVVTTLEDILELLTDIGGELYENLDADDYDMLLRRIESNINKLKD